MSVPSLTLCMIVRNEAESVADALESAAPYVDDMVIVDTGSSDETPAVVRRYTRRLYRIQWNDDFAVARNFAMEHVRTEWILWLDADEQLAVVDESRWRQSWTAKARTADAVLVPIHNYYGPVVDELKMHVHTAVRLLRTAAKLRYKQTVHEHLDVGGKSVRLDPDPLQGAVIRHYGYMDHARQQEKSARNVRLLEKERARPGYDPWIDYHLAVEAYRRGDYVQAYDHVQTSLKRFLEMRRLPPALAYKLKYELLLMTGSTERALEGIELAIRLYPDYPDLHYYKGLFQYGQGQFEEAAKTFTECLRIGENTRYLTLRGTGSFMAAHMLGMSLEALGKPDAAARLYERLVQEYPGFEPPAARLAALRQGKGEA
ncbi:MAG: hypothetical protein BAA04_02325 [Firmicutes bacterium ZCTH02-B6]|nr:MAG: hypothetical protein BAA04_02325 [Firmicutes bacterium ZCTH02-B6]